MIEGAEAFYHRIAQSMQDSIPEEWNTAQMEVIFYPSKIVFTGEYTRKADGVSRDFGTPRDGERAFRELRNKFKEAGKTLWGQAYFELQSNGKFNLRWGYDNLDDNGNTRWDSEAEYKRLEDRRKRLTSG